MPRVSEAAGESLFERVLGNRPELWKAFQFQYGAMCEYSLLDVRTRELVRLKSAFINGCKDCQVARSAEAYAGGLDESTVAKIHDFRASDLPADIQVALDFAERWYLDHAQTIDEALFAELRRYYSDPQIVELAVAVGNWEYFHKFKMVFEIEAGSPDLRVRGDGEVPEAMRMHLEGLRDGQAPALSTATR